MAAVEEGQLAHERVEPAIGREQIAQGHGKQSGRPAGPDEQGKVGEIPAPDDGFGDLVECVHDLFLRKSSVGVGARGK